MKKIILTIIILIMFPFPLLANVPNLTLEEATRLAINNSTQIRNLESNITLSREGQQRIRDLMWTNPQIPASDFVRMQADMMRLDANRAVSLSSITAQEQTLEFIISNHFANIIMAQNELEIFDKNISLIQRDLNNLRIMQSLGMASNSQIDSVVTSHRQALNNRENLISSIDSAFRELNRLMGTNQNNVYNVIFEPTFNNLNDINLNEFISRHQNNSVQIENITNQLRIARFELDNHRLDFTPASGMVSLTEPTRSDRELQVTQTNRDLREAREQVENNITDLYNQIINLELTIEGMELQLAILNQEIRVLEVQYEVGQITAIELDRKLLEKENLTENIRRQKTNHYLLLMRLNNPNILVG
ncbi:MAG: TolC family protein [Defluviitaleaceae bacterium]|nr:TolC family protein [Defluviitaleaceae bacterium]